MKKQTVTASFKNGLKFEISKEHAKKVIELQKWIKYRNKQKNNI
jgi:hypothetical protein